MSNASDIKDPNNGCTLADLKLKNNENLGAFKKSMYVQRKEAIVMDDTVSGEPKLTTMAQDSIQEIFNRYSIEKDGIKIMNKEISIEFTKECTATSADEKDHRVVAFWKNYDSEDTGFVTLDRFEKFFLDAVVNGNELTLRLNF